MQILPNGQRMVKEMFKETILKETQKCKSGQDAGFAVVCIGEKENRQDSKMTGTYQTRAIQMLKEVEEGGGGN